MQTKKLEESDLGWYYIDAMWDLWLDGELHNVHVDFICVDEAAYENERGTTYVVDHYNRNGGLITTLRLDAGDILPEIRDKETTDRPWHI